jgi:hypothetical protein
VRTLGSQTRVHINIGESNENTFICIGVQYFSIRAYRELYIVLLVVLASPMRCIFTIEKSTECWGKTFVSLPGGGNEWQRVLSPGNGIAASVWCVFC